MKVVTEDTKILTEDVYLYETFLKGVYGLEDFSLIKCSKSLYLKIQFYEDSEKEAYHNWNLETAFISYRLTK